MKIAEKPINEQDRLKALDSYRLVDTLPEKDYDDITLLASAICQTPISLISIIDEKRQWFKSHRGLDATETPRELAFCAHTILNPNEIMVVPDSRKDERFFDNPLATDNPFVIFYAGAPLVTPEGYTLGSLCVIDNKPNMLSESQLEALKALANQLMNLLELRKLNIQLNETQVYLRDRNENLEKFTYIAAHDIKSPLVNIISLTELIANDETLKANPTNEQCVTLINQSAHKLSDMVNGLLTFYRSDQTIKNQKEQVELHSFIKSIIQLLPKECELAIKLPEKNSVININKVAIQQVLLNILTNSIKYNDKTVANIQILFSEDSLYYSFEVIDNGVGIKPENQTDIFTLFSRSSQKDRFGNLGTGIGLATVKKIVESQGGTISLTSEYGVGTTMRFTIEK